MSGVLRTIQKVIKSGRSRHLSMTKWIPPNWVWVEITKVDEGVEDGEEYIVLKIKGLTI